MFKIIFKMFCTCFFHKFFGFFWFAKKEANSLQRLTFHKIDLGTQYASSQTDIIMRFLAIILLRSSLRILELLHFSIHKVYERRRSLDAYNSCLHALRKYCKSSNLIFSVFLTKNSHVAEANLLSLVQYAQHKI